MHDETKDHGSEVHFPGSDVRLRGVSFGSAASRCALLLLPDVHGLSPLYREIGARFAASGMHTLVLDPYVREGAPRLTDMAAVQTWIAELPDARVLDDVAHAVAYLRSSDGGAAARVGIVGFCLGGQYALMAASRQAGLDACVAFYGMLRHGRESAQKLPAPIDTAADLRCPVLGLFGADDPLIPAADRDGFHAAALRGGKAIDLRVFAGAGHAFVNDRRPDAYRPEAAAEAMRVATTFLRSTLAAPASR